MSKQIIILIAILAVGIILFSSNKAFLVENPNNKPIFSLPLPGLTDALSLNSNLVNLTMPTVEKPLDPILQSELDSVWNVLQEYREFAITHDLEGLASLSHQLSSTCADPKTEEECFGLMDSVYIFTQGFEKEMFRNVVSDSRQTIIYTDAPERVFLYFTKDSSGQRKILGLRFCQEDSASSSECVEDNASTVDGNNNGWWDSVESFFY